MSNAMELAELSMIQDMERLKIISNNLANVTTVGFKRDISLSASFETALQKQFSQTGSVDSQQPFQLPDNQSLVTQVDMQPGTFKFTGNPLDVAIETNAFFKLYSNGQSFFTRQGNFSIDQSGRLVSQHGYAVQGTSGDIMLNTSSPRIDSQGRIWDGDNLVAQLQLYSTGEVSSLEKAGGGIFRFNGAEPHPVNDDSLTLRPGYLENSNVNTMQAMVNMIATTRHFESAQRVMKTYDEMMDSAIRSLGSNL
ncbi:MAG: flagellar hook-basal body protein [Gammaproteobacteria bacterium]|nr:flagellar hook-basal body protein [Gammaproteobacteria bacterium]MDH5729791.1 flagellar hook-basal body protein [Gammaproteobacteria bacterium]